MRDDVCRGQISLHATFADLLRRYRHEAGVTQEELAERSGVSAKGISALERRVNRAPRRDTLLLLARALNLGQEGREMLEAAARRSRALPQQVRPMPSSHPAAIASAWSAPTTIILSSAEATAYNIEAVRDECVGDQAAACNTFHDAIATYKSAVRRLDTLGHMLHAAAVREKLGAALLNVAQYDEALEVLLAASRIYRGEGSVRGTLRALARLGEVHALRGTSAEGIAMLRSVATTRQAADFNDELAAVYIALAWLTNCTGRYAEALSIVEQAVDLTRKTANVHLQVQANLRYGHLTLMLGSLDQGARIVSETIPLAEALGDLRSLRFAYNNLGWAHELRGEFAADRTNTELATEAAVSLGDPTVQAFMTSNHGSPAFNMGNWAQARADFEQGFALNGQLGASWASAWPHVLLGQLDLAEGRYSDGDTQLKVAIARAERNHDLQALRWAHGALAEHELLAGDAHAALARVTPLVKRDETDGVDIDVLLPLQAWAYVEVANYSCAADIIETALTHARAARLIPTEIAALRVRSLLAARQEEFQQAHYDLQTALMLAHESRHLYAIGKVHRDLGQLYAGMADQLQAREQARAAMSIFEPLGERMYATHATYLLV
jgi:tetratricopeptide (TPR) repeat protein